MSKRSTRSNWLSVGLVSAAVGVLAWGAQGVGAQEQSGQGFSFKSAVDLVNVTATVTDSRGRFVPGLRAEDFTIFENGKRQTISQFDAERVPVSLGIVIDTSGSMQGEKMADAKAAVSRFVDLLGPQDEMFLYRFDSQPTLIQGWTDDRRALVRALNGIRPSGGTAMYDAVAEAVPLAASGTRRKKALVVISDGEDTNSTIPLREVQALIRESELLIYAIGIGGSGGSVYSPQTRTLPIPIPGGGRIEFPLPGRRAPTSRIPGGGSSGGVNEGALRTITDDSGGRTEIIGSSRDLDSATAGIADELSQQYFLGYVSTLPKDGRWHTIDVQVRRGNYNVRARKGYTAS